MLRRTIKGLVPELTRIKTRFVYYFLRSFFLQGSKHHCNICGFKAKGFDDKEGRFARSGVCCPRCRSLERQRFLWAVIERHDLLSAGDRILHIAPEWGLQRKLKKMEQLEYFSADLYSSLAEDKEDLQALSYPNAAFEIVFIAHVLSHVENDLIALKELGRVLNAEGKIFLFDRFDPQLEKTFEDPEAKTEMQRLRTFGQDDLARIYGRDFQSRISEQGFSIQTISAQSLGKDAIQLLALDPQEELYILRKASL